MRLLQFLTFAVAASATPVPGVVNAVAEKPRELVVRQVVPPVPVPVGNNLAQVLLETVNTTSSLVSTALGNIQDIISSAEDNVNVDVQAVVEANLVAITTALQTGTTAITNAIAAAGGNIAAIVAQFTSAQVAQVLAALTDLVGLLTGLGVQLTLAINNLEGVAPAVLAGLQDELAAVQAALQPFIAPIQGVVAAVTAVNASVGVVATGLNALIPGLLGIITSLVNGS